MHSKCIWLVILDVVVKKSGRSSPINSLSLEEHALKDNNWANFTLDPAEMSKRREDSDSRRVRPSSSSHSVSG